MLLNPTLRQYLSMKIEIACRWLTRAIKCVNLIESRYMYLLRLEEILCSYQ
jgi:hypothetical protein